MRLSIARVLGTLALALVAGPASAEDQCEAPLQRLDVPGMCGALLRDGVASQCQNIRIPGRQLPGQAIGGVLKSGLRFVVVGFDCAADYLDELKQEDDEAEHVWRARNDYAFVVGAFHGDPSPRATAARLAAERTYFRTMVDGR